MLSFNSCSTVSKGISSMMFKPCRPLHEGGVFHGTSFFDSIGGIDADYIEMVLTTTLVCNVDLSAAYSLSVVM